MHFKALAIMLKITIEILKFDTNGREIVTTVCPSHGASNYVVNIVLLLQFHYVGLDPVYSINVIEHVSNDNSVSSINVADSCNGSTNIAPNTDDLNDEVIALGDEHNMSINGGPQICSIFSVENPETENQILSITPAEGQKPVSMTFDTGFEEMSNLDKFPFGTGGFNTERPVRLTYRKYFNQRLLNVDGCFCDLEYLFVAEYIVAQKQIFDDMHNFF